MTRKSNGDIGNRSTDSHRDAGGHRAEVDSRTRNHQPAPDQIIDQLVGQDDDIGGLAGEQAQPHRMHAAKDRRATACMLALELLGSALDHCLRGTCAENVESLHI